MNITEVQLSKLSMKQIDKLPNHLKRKLRLWIHEVGRIGINKLKGNKAFRDEGLKGKRLGQRSIRLNRGYRLIYEIHEQCVFILEVNKHEY